MGILTIFFLVIMAATTCVNCCSMIKALGGKNSKYFTLQIQFARIAKVVRNNKQISTEYPIIFDYLRQSETLAFMETNQLKKITYKQFSKLNEEQFAIFSKEFKHLPESLQSCVELQNTLQEILLKSNCPIQYNINNSLRTLL